MNTEERDHWDGCDHWFGELERVCKKAKVRLHPRAPRWQDCHICSSLRQDEETSLDSWPVVLDEQDEGDEA